VLRIQSPFFGWPSRAIAEWHTPRYFEADNLVLRRRAIREAGRVVHPLISSASRPLVVAHCGGLGSVTSRGETPRAARSALIASSMFCSSICISTKACFARPAATVRARSIRCTWRSHAQCRPSWVSSYRFSVSGSWQLPTTLPRVPDRQRASRSSLPTRGLRVPQPTKPLPRQNRGRAPRRAENSRLPQRSSLVSAVSGRRRGRGEPSPAHRDAG
jgi:hypothetical protein